MKRLILVALVLGLALPTLTGCGRCKCMKEGVAAAGSVPSAYAGQDTTYTPQASSARQAIK
ncbi:MAG: hypothetical protein HYS55_05045 [Candidatus Omnitrophica bacterium]|nr:hypothetical protein [Candidatus Omnitrophota bacterium]